LKLAEQEGTAMIDKKQSQPDLYQPTHATFKNRLKGVIITVSIWGWLPLSLAKWILKKDGLVKTTKHCRKIV
jgi:hypothetical protein